LYFGGGYLFPPHFFPFKFHYNSFPLFFQVFRVEEC
jgi:hypothetical protein